MNQPDEQPPPNDRKLRIAAFATHAARGLLHDRQTRRQVMFWVVIAALVMLFAGATFLAPVLNPRIRPGWFILYWVACAWVTVTAVLLALLDLLQVRVQSREEKRRLAREMAEREEAGDAD